MNRTPPPPFNRRAFIHYGLSNAFAVHHPKWKWLQVIPYFFHAYSWLYQNWQVVLGFLFGVSIVIGLTHYYLFGEIIELLRTIIHSIGIPSSFGILLPILIILHFIKQWQNKSFNQKYLSLPVSVKNQNNLYYFDENTCPFIAPTLFEESLNYHRQESPFLIQTLVANGGMGKSRLALEIAKKLEEEGWDWGLCQLQDIENKNSFEDCPFLTDTVLIIDYANANIAHLIRDLKSRDSRQDSSTPVIKIRVVLLFRFIDQLDVFNWYNQLMRDMDCADYRLDELSTSIPQLDEIAEKFATNAHIVRHVKEKIRANTRLQFPLAAMLLVNDYERNSGTNHDESGDFDLDKLLEQQSKHDQQMLIQDLSPEVEYHQIYVVIFLATIRQTTLDIKQCDESITLFMQNLGWHWDIPNHLGKLKNHRCSPNQPQNVLPYVPDLLGEKLCCDLFTQWQGQSVHFKDSLLRLLQDLDLSPKLLELLIQDFPQSPLTQYLNEHWGKDYAEAMWPLIAVYAQSGEIEKASPVIDFLRSLGAASPQHQLVLAKGLFNYMSGLSKDPTRFAEAEAVLEELRALSRQSSPQQFEIQLTLAKGLVNYMSRLVKDPTRFAEAEAVLEELRVLSRQSSPQQSEIQLRLANGLVNYMYGFNKDPTRFKDAEAVLEELRALSCQPNPQQFEIKLNLAQGLVNYMHGLTEDPTRFAEVEAVVEELRVLSHQSNPQQSEIQLRLAKGLVNYMHELIKDPTRFAEAEAVMEELRALNHQSSPQKFEIKLELAMGLVNYMHELIKDSTRFAEAEAVIEELRALSRQSSPQQSGIQLNLAKGLVNYVGGLAKDPTRFAEAEAVMEELRVLSRQSSPQQSEIQLRLANGLVNYMYGFNKDPTRFKDAEAVLEELRALSCQSSPQQSEIKLNLAKGLFNYMNGLTKDPTRFAEVEAVMEELRALSRQSSPQQSEIQLRLANGLVNYMVGLAKDPTRFAKAEAVMGELRALSRQPSPQQFEIKLTLAEGLVNYMYGLIKDPTEDPTRFAEAEAVLEELRSLSRQSSPQQSEIQLRLVKGLRNYMHGFTKDLTRFAEAEAVLEELRALSRQSSPQQSDIQLELANGLLNYMCGLTEDPTRFAEVEAVMEELRGLSRQSSPQQSEIQLTLANGLLNYMNGLTKDPTRFADVEAVMEELRALSRQSNPQQFEIKLTLAKGLINRQIRLANHQLPLHDCWEELVDILCSIMLSAPLNQSMVEALKSVIQVARRFDEFNNKWRQRVREFERMPSHETPNDNEKDT